MAKQKIFNPDGFVEEVNVSFFYNPVMKLTSRDFQKLEERKYIPGCMRDSGEKIYLSSKIKHCTPLQAHLLEFNFEYTRLE